MRLLIKLSCLITIVFCAFILGGCGSEEPPESQTTVTKKINLKPPVTPNGSKEPPESQTTVTKKINIKPPTTPKPITSKAEPSKAMPDTAKKTPELASKDKETVPPVAVDKSEPSEASEGLSESDKLLIAKNEVTKPVRSTKAVPTKEETPEKSISPSVSAKQPDSSKASTEPKDNSNVNLAPELDDSQEDDSALSESNPEASPSLKTQTQDSELELAPEKTTSSYDPKGRYDPFVPFIKKAQPTQGPAPKEQRHRGPLEKFDVDQLQLVGIIRAPSGNLALVQLADGKGYIIQKGTPIGINEGHVAEILAGQVVVEEHGVDSHNDPITKERLMKIKKPIGEL